MKLPFEYSIKKSLRAKQVRIAISRYGEVKVTIPRRVPIFIGERFVQSHINWITQKLEEYKNKPGENLLIKYTQADFQRYKNDALKICNERLAYFNQFYGYKYNRITIRNQSSRWGSCSNKGNLNFNFRILFLTEFQRDYIIVHELCHLKEMNHSDRFWALVSKTIPNYKLLRKELRLNE